MKRYIYSFILTIALYAVLNFLYAWGSNLDLRILGKLSFIFITLALSISPLLTLWFNQKILPYRRVFWVMSFIFAVLHIVSYSIAEFKYSWSLFVVWNLKNYDISSWVMAFLIISILWVTSNNYSVRILKNNWSKLQSLTYPLYIIVALHIAFASRFDIIYVIMISALAALRMIAYSKSSNEITVLGISTRYICVPCSYIYDEKIWDPDSWIPAWTKFEDIPDDWVCPVCGAWKDVFKPIWWNEESAKDGNSIATVTWTKMLTNDVLELTITTIDHPKIIPGQYMIFKLKDENWNFERAYSISSYENWHLRFCIKLLPQWRWWMALPKLKIWDELEYLWIFWNFTLQDTDSKKVFVATWTWLSPALSMIKSVNWINSELHFWVRTKEDIFYEEDLKSILWERLHIYLSAIKESEDWYLGWRVDIDVSKYGKDTEFYLCGSPDMISGITKKLSETGFDKIYSEKF